MKSTLSKLQIKMLLDGKSLHMGHNGLYISKENQVYDILSEVYNDKYQTRKVIVDTEERKFTVENVWRISWNKAWKVSRNKSEAEPEYTGDYKFADKDLNCKLVRTKKLHDEFKDGYIWFLLVKNKESLDWRLISAFKWYKTDIEEEMLKMAKYKILLEFGKADAKNVDFNDYMKELVKYVPKI
nr:MAG TPA: hypothetical protein [Caudoviricetes sp.]